MDKELQNKVDDFINEFLSVPEVKQYLLLKKQIEESNEIQELKENLRLSQKKMALSLGTKDYEIKKKKYYECKDAYENNPLITNFNVIQEDVYSLINELKTKLK